MDNDILFKKAAFGGFDKEDVMNYIAKITDEFLTYKNQTIATIDKLQEKIGELEKEKNELQEKYDALCEDMNGIQEQTEEKEAEPSVNTDEIKHIIESLYENINGFMSVLGGSENKPAEEENENVSKSAPEVELGDDELLKIIDKYVD